MVAPVNQVFTQGSTTPVSADQLNTFVQTAASVASMRAFTGTIGMQIELQGTTGAGTGNAGTFCWNATSTAADDGANVIAPTGSTTGRWIRNLETASLSGFTVTSTDGQNTVTVAPGNINRAFSSAAPQVYSQYNSNASGGTSGNVTFNGKFYSSIFGAPNEYIWNLLGVVDFDGTGGTGQHVGVYAQGVRRTFVAGGTANNPQIWGAVAQVVDLTGQPSSATNATLGMEIDISGNGADDGNNREGLSVVASTVGSGAAAVIGTGIGLWSPGASFKVGYNASFTYTTAAMDFRNGTKTSGHTIWLGNLHDIAFDTAGLSQVNYDATLFSGTGGIHFTGKVQVDSDFYVPNIITVGGLATLAGGGSVTGTWSVSVPGTAGNQVTNFSQFAPLVNPAGYIHLPGGVTMQWGNGTGPTANITLPYTFASAPWSITCTIKDAAVGGSAVFVQTTTGTVLAGSFTVTTVTAPGAGVAANFWWFAVGQT